MQYYPEGFITLENKNEVNATSKGKRSSN
jgi:hypothetical protein